MRFVSAVRSFWSANMTEIFDGKHVGLRLAAPREQGHMRSHYTNLGAIAAVASGIANSEQGGKAGRMTLELDHTWKGNQVDTLCEVLSLYYHVASAAAPFLETNILIPHVSGVSTLERMVDLDILASTEESISEAEQIQSARESAGIEKLPVQVVQGRKMESVQEIIKASQISEEVENALFKVNGFKNVACGGTFDRLHAGHKVLLSAAAMLAEERLVVGVSGDPLLKSKKFADLLQPYNERENAVNGFVSTFKPGLRVECVELLEPFGPTITESSLEVLVVSDETKDGGNAINVKRRELNMPEMSVLSIKLVGASASKLSSTWYREQDSRIAGQGESKM